MPINTCSPRAVRRPRFARAALAAAVVATLGLGGCKMLGIGKKNQPMTQPTTQASTKPATPAVKSPHAHGGVMANVTNKPFPARPASGTLGSIERLDPRLDELLDKDASMELLAQGFDWSEGPVWDKQKNVLYFSDVPQNVVYVWQPGKPGVSEFARPSGYTGSNPRGGEPGSNGLTIDTLGRLVLCQHGDRAVSRLDGFQPKDANTPKYPIYTALADRFEGKRFNSPNDLCFDTRGNLFFTDPPYGLPGNMKDKTKEIEFQGVYRLSNKGELKVLTKEMSRPNGIALSPDERTVYVANSDGDKPVIMAYPLKEDGTVEAGKVFFDAAELAKDKKNKGMPDGLKVDTAGNLWATGPGGVLVIAPDGTLLGILRTGQNTANVAFGDDGSTLYITADMYLAKVKTKAKGW